ncbi:hypothetical protein [Cognatilysobacter terrigena]|uniref:hypothetical protein n=1 Tax=Cognatilysobacter terrigena TaxID=2488749 RepID=UPI001060CAA0|nr:hypothetical protein [Lysobacter terrigena]
MSPASGGRYTAGPDVRPQPTDKWWRGAAALAVVAFLVSFAVRAYFVTQVTVRSPTGGDAGQYVAYALNLYRHATFAMTAEGLPLVPDAWRSPGYPAFLAALFAAFGLDQAYMPILVAQALLGALTVAFAALLAQRVAGRPAAIAVAVPGAFWPHLVASSAYLLSEVLYGALVVVPLWWLSTLDAVRASRRSAGAGLLAGLAWLTNPVSAVIWVLAAIVLAIRGRRRCALVFLLTFLMAPIGWSVRDAVSVHSDGPGSSDRAWMNFVQGSHPEYHVVHWSRLANAMTPAGVEAWNEIDAEIAVGTQSRRAGLARVTSRLMQTPGESLRWYLLEKPATLWGWDIRVGQGGFYVFPTYNSPYERNAFFRVVASICFGLNALIGLAALAGVVLVVVRAARRQTRENVTLGEALVAATLIAATAVHMVLQAEPRYAVPYRMVEFIAAAIATRAVVQWFIAHRRNREGML